MLKADESDGTENRIIQHRIHEVASDFYKDKTDYSLIKVFTVGEFKVLAESQIDADHIYALANKQEPV